MSSGCEMIFPPAVPRITIVDPRDSIEAGDENIGAEIENCDETHHVIEDGHMTGGGKATGKSVRMLGIETEKIGVEVGGTRTKVELPKERKGENEVEKQFTVVMNIWKSP